MLTSKASETLIQISARDLHLRVTRLTSRDTLLTAQALALSARSHAAFLRFDSAIDLFQKCLAGIALAAPYGFRFFSRAAVSADLAIVLLGIGRTQRAEEVLEEAFQRLNAWPQVHEDHPEYIPLCTARALTFID